MIQEFSSSGIVAKYILINLTPRIIKLNNIQNFLAIFKTKLHFVYDILQVIIVKWYLQIDIKKKIMNTLSLDQKFSNKDMSI